MPNQDHPRSCGACQDLASEPFPFSMAFQPIVDVEANSVFAYEALVRSEGGDSAAPVLSQVTAENRYAFDENCRVKALSLAALLHLADTSAALAINFMPRAVYSASSCIQVTLDTAEASGFPCERLIFEITEGEELVNKGHLRDIVDDYRQRGFRIALDDFGAGYSGLNLLADLSPDIIKLDMQLIRNLAQRPAALAIVRCLAGLAKELDSDLIAEGVETVEEYAALRDCGIHLMQGYLLARPAYERLPCFTLPGA